MLAGIGVREEAQMSTHARHAWRCARRARPPQLWLRGTGAGAPGIIYFIYEDPRDLVNIVKERPRSVWDAPRTRGQSPGWSLGSTGCFLCAPQGFGKDRQGTPKISMARAKDARPVIRVPLEPLRDCKKQERSRTSSAPHVSTQERLG
eukprot:297632-Chlamydomonas_euryale.AAC.2